MLHRKLEEVSQANRAAEAAEEAAEEVGAGWAVAKLFVLGRFVHRE